jgi:hypothetical protein
VEDRSKSKHKLKREREHVCTGRNVAAVGMFEGTRGRRGSKRE